MRKQLVIEVVLVLSLLASTNYTIFVEPGVPSVRPWLLPVAVAAMASGLLGLGFRIRGRGRMAGACYCLAALAPNGLYVINILLLAAGLVALAGVVIGPKPGHDVSPADQI